MCSKERVRISMLEQHTQEMGSAVQQMNLKPPNDPTKGSKTKRIMQSTYGESRKSRRSGGTRMPQRTIVKRLRLTKMGRNEMVDGGWWNAGWWNGASSEILL